MYITFLSKKTKEWSFFFLLIIGSVLPVQALEFSSIDNTNVEIKSANINIQTDEVSQVYVKYGLNSANFIQSEISSGKRNHVITLKNLKGGHVYHYRVVAESSSRDNIISAGKLLRLKKTSLEEPVAVIKRVDILDISSSSAVINVELDREAVATLNYGRGSYNGGSLVSTTAEVTHRFELNGLDEEQVYHFEIDTKTPDGFSADGEDRLLRLNKLDASDATHLLVNKRGAKSATITWRTNSSTTGHVFYRKANESSNLEFETTTPKKNHSITLPDLAENTEYQFFVESTDVNGSVSTSKTLSFRTLDSHPNSPLLMEVDVSYLNHSNSEGFVRVVTEEDTRAWVTFGPSFRPEVSRISDFNKNHGIRLPNLIPGLFYRLEIHIEDADGNLYKQIQFFNPATLVVIENSTITSEPGHLVNSFLTPRTNKVCRYDISDIDAYSDIKLDCLLDLNNQTKVLKEGITLRNAGGDIINGTLRMDHGEIDHDLLNSSVTVKGAEIKSTLDNYTLDILRWPITEGIVEDSVAKNNKHVLQHAFDQMAIVKTSKLTLPNLDAFFSVGQYDHRIHMAKTGIIIPSNTNLVMQDNTLLRVQPNGYVKYSIFGTYNATNITITGGVLIGDRDQHNYEDPRSDKRLQWDGTLIRIKGSTNITVDGVTFIDAMGDGLSMSSLRGYGKPDHIGTQHINIINNVFDNNRRLGIAITSGSEILVDGNTFLNSGQPTEYSTSASPGWALDVEGARRRSDERGLYYIERPYNIVISNNIEKNSYEGAFIVAIGDHVDIINNTTESRLAIGQGSFVNIINNKVTFNEASHVADFSILNGHDGETTFYPIIDGLALENNVISYNTLINQGIRVSGSDTDIYNNTIVNASQAFAIENAKNINIYNNEVLVTDDAPLTYLNGSAKKYNGIKARFSINNINIHDNKVDVRESPLLVQNINTEHSQSTYNLKIKDNVFTTKTGKFSSFSNAKNVTVEGNSINGIEVSSESTNFLFKANVINQTTSHGINISRKSTEINILDNIINYGGRRSECIKISLDSVVTQENNNCHRLN